MQTYRKSRHKKRTLKKNKKEKNIKINSSSGNSFPGLLTTGPGIEVGGNSLFANLIPRNFCSEPL